MKTTMIENEDIFFSVCIPVYNAKIHLAECIQSALSQKLDGEKFELILVDDGSEDGSEQICDEYEDRYCNIRVIHKKNEGTYAARYDAIMMARGHYLLFMDADDIFLPDAFKEIKEFIGKTHADMVMFDCIHTMQNGSRIYETINYENGEIFEGSKKKDIYRELTVNSTISSIWSKCIKRSLADGENFKRYIDVIQSEDQLMLLPITDKSTRIAYLKKALYCYRENPMSVTHNMTIKNYKSIQVLDSILQQYMKKWDMPLDALYRNRVVFGINVVLSVTGRIKGWNTKQKEFADVINYIGNDCGYAKALELSKSSLSLHHKMMSRVIMKKHIQSAFIFGWGYICSRKLYNGLYRIFRRKIRCI